MSAPEDVDWATALESALSAPGRIRGVVQPIADLQRGAVVGYELLARFAGPPDATPDRWFAAAARLGRGPELARRTVELGLDRLATLPPNTFLTINLEPSHLVDDGVLHALGSRGRLDRLFIELTEHAVIEDVEALRPVMGRLRTLGARIAVDDAGSGYAGLALLLSLRPELIKLDRELVVGVDTDPVKRVLIRALGDLASSIDAWVLAEGVETVTEVDELVALEVPLGQGWAFGRPDPDFAAEVPFDVVEAIARRVARREHPHRAVALLEDAPRITRDEPARAGRIRVVVDDLDRPVAVDTDDGTRDEHPLLAHPSERLATLARRAAARPAPRWTFPIVLIDGRGVTAGVVDVRRLLEGATDEADD